MGLPAPEIKRIETFFFVSILFFIFTTAHAADVWKSCESKRDFIGEILGKQFDYNLALNDLRERKLVLVGESHMEGERSAYFYKRLFENQFNPGAKNCLFMELDEKSFQKTLDECFEKKENLAHPSCEDLSFTIKSIFKPVFEARKTGRISKVIAIDDQTELPNESEYDFDRKREKHMAGRIEHLVMTDDCSKAIWVGGVSHLTGTDSSIPNRLKGKTKEGPAIIQIVYTGPGRWSDDKAKKYDPRWHPFQDLNYCKPELPRFTYSFAVKGSDLPSYPIIPEGLENQISEPFGNWKDFEYSFFIDFFEGSSR